MKYIYVINGVLDRIIDDKPRWYLDGGEEPSDQWFIENEGLYPLYDPLLGDPTKYTKPNSEWLIEVDRVTKTYYTIIDNGNTEIPESIGNFAVRTEPEAWSADGDTLTVVYEEGHRMDYEVDAFILSHIIDPNGYDPDLHLLRPRDQWLWDSESFSIKQIYWPIIKKPVGEIGSELDEMFYDILIMDSYYWELKNDGIHQTWSTSEKPIDWIKTSLKEYLAEYRWIIEVGGCLYNTIGIQTDRESQAKLNSVYSLISTGVMSGDVEWKVVDGFHTFTETDFTTMNLHVFTFISEIYAKESFIVDQIDSATTMAELITIRTNIDVDMHNVKSVYCIDNMGV